MDTNDFSNFFNDDMLVILEEYGTDDYYSGLLMSCFDELDDEEFIKTINKWMRTKERLRIENEVLAEFINTHDRLTDEGTDDNHSQSTADFNSDLFTENRRINLSTRIDVLDDYITAKKGTFQNFLVSMHRELNELNARNEETQIRLKEIDEARADFQRTMQMSIDPNTKRVPAEKFLHYMREWQKRAGVHCDQLRLRNNSMKTIHNKLSNVLENKRNEATRLTDVDFHDVYLQNTCLLRDIAKQSADLIDLKQYCGNTNLYVCTKKRNLQALCAAEKDVQTKIAKLETDIVNIKKECVLTKKSLDEAQAIYKSITYMISNCHGPDVMDYITAKAILDEQQKESKTLERKEYLLNIEMAKTRQAIMALTGTNFIRKEWLEPMENSEEELEESTHEVCSSPSSSNEFDIFTVLQSVPLRNKSSEIPIK